MTLRHSLPQALSRRDGKGLNYKQLDLKLNAFAKKILNISRTELATEKYELCKWSSEIDSLRKLEKEQCISETEKLRLKYLIDKLNLIFQREEETKSRKRKIKFPFPN